MRASNAADSSTASSSKMCIRDRARIPSVITSTFAGSQFAEGSWDVSLVVFLATGAVAGLCVIFQDRILAGIAALKGKFSLEKHGDL